MNTTIIVTSIVSVAALISIIIINNTWRTSIYERRASNADNYRYQLMNSQVSENTLNIIDNIIQDVFNRYQIMNLAHQENLYISDKQQYQIIQEIFETVHSSISEVLFDKLSLIYKKDYINDLIAQRVQMVVLNFVIEVNGSYVDTRSE